MLKKLTLKSSDYRIITAYLASLIAVCVFFLSCGKAYKDITTENGRRAISETANSFLSAGQCNRAIEVMQPLYDSIYVNTEIRLVYSSAYACAGGFNFAALIAGLSSTPFDIWSSLVKSNFSALATDGRTTNLQRAAEILRTTTTNSGSQQAVDRPSDANLYMVFMQIELISTTISTSSMGLADESTGKKTRSINTLGTAAEKCVIEVAVATISDCLNVVSTGTAIDTLNTTIQAICGGACPTNKNPAVCSAAEQAQGDALITAIDGQWTLF